MLTSPRSVRIKTETTITTPRQFKNSVKEFIQKGVDLNGSHQDEFIPYAQERDSLGNLLTKRASMIPKMTRNPSCPPGKMKTVPRLNFGMLPDPSAGSEFCFDNFKFQARVMHMTPKVSYKKLIKPINSSRTFQDTLSPSFRSPGRNTTRLRQTMFEEFPGVGHYDISDDITHKATKKVIFTKELKEKPMTSMRGYDSHDFDLMKAYNNAYQPRIYVPDFTKQTNRETHYHSKSQKNLVIGKDLGKYSDSDKYKDIVIKNTLDIFVPKENLQEPEPSNNFA